MKQNNCLNSKQRRRRENKKRKMTAFCAISKLNEEDRKKAMLKSLGTNLPIKEEVQNGLYMDNTLLEKNKSMKVEAELTLKEGIESVDNINKMESKKRKFDEFEEEVVKGNPDIAKRHLPDDELKELRLLIRNRLTAKKKLPKLNLKAAGLQAELDHPKEHRIPLFLSDVQHFLLYSMHGHHTTGNIPRWVQIEKFTEIKHVLFLVVEGMSMNDYNKYQHLCPKLNEFTHKLEVVTPLTYGGYLVREMATLPLTESQRYKLEKKFSSMEEAVSSNKVYKALRTMFPMGFKSKTEKEEYDKNEVKKNAFSRTELLLSPLQMLEEGYPLQLEGEMKAKFANYVYTKDCYKEVCSNSPMWALDCEMSLTKEGSELVRLTIINEQMEVVYETYVKPHNPIINYLTRFSGVTAKHLENVQTRLEDVQNKLREIMPPDVILIGHSLNADLNALKMLHPYCIDTSVIFNLSGDRIRKTKLKVLSANFLGEQIQCDTGIGHDSNEDAAACMKLVQAKLQHSIGWGDAVISGTDLVDQIIKNALQERKMNSQKKPVTQAMNGLLREENSQEKQTMQDDTHIQVPVVRLYNSLPKHVVGNNVVQVQMFTTSLFSHLITREKKCVLVAKSSVVNEFGKYVPNHLRPFQPESRLTILSQDTNKAVVKFGRNNVPESGVSLMYSIVERKPEPTAAKVDHLVTKLTKGLSGNVLVAVLLAGRSTEFDEVDTNNHGVLLIKLHRDEVPPIRLARDLPRTMDPTAQMMDCESTY